MMNQQHIGGWALAALLLCLAADADAGHGDHRRHGPVYDYAQVLSARPVVRYVTVREPVRECHEEIERYTTYRHPPGIAGRTIAGAILGGVLGHQFGSGHGNDAATAAGVIIGATIGHDSAHRHAAAHHGRVEHARPVTRCATYYRDRREKRIDGYDVVYRYHGQKYATRMPHQPGRKIRVRVDIRPAR